MAAYDSRTKLEALRDHFETFGKGANYLLVGNGAGFVGCLSVVKDNLKTWQQQFEGLGQLVLLFGSGLLFGSLFWFATMVIKINVTQTIIAQERPSRTWPRWIFNRTIELLAHLGLWGSLIAFVTAIIVIMSRFADAIPPELMGWWARVH